jgi:hypothetical protein
MLGYMPRPAVTLAEAANAAATSLFLVGCGAHGTTAASPVATPTVTASGSGSGAATPGPGSGSAVSDSPSSAAPTSVAPISAAPTASAAASAPPSTARPTGPVGCPTSDLRLSLGPANGAAGSTYYPLVFTNSGSASCTVAGYPGVSYVSGSSGTQVGAAATRDPGHAAVITLAPGGSASALLREGQAGAFGCRQTEVRGLRVYPPGDRQAAFLAQPGQACTTPVRQLSVGPLYPGSTGQA